MTEANRPAHIHPSDFSALARVLTDATTGMIDLVEHFHMEVAPPPRALGPAADITPLTYRAIRGLTRAVGGGIDATLGQVAHLFGRREDPPSRRAVLAVMNGLMGDYLAESDSPLALPMTFRHDDEDLLLDPDVLADAMPEATGKVVVLVHGLCMSDRGWTRKTAAGPHDHGVALARDLGYTPIYLSYNSGRHISTNGRELARLLDRLSRVWPVPIERLAIIGHSMGGLVARSAAHYGAEAGYDWIDQLNALVFLGTPHHGTPLEQKGNGLNTLIDATPFVSPFGRLGKGRSAGITDLRYSGLLDEDWMGRDRFAHAPDDRRIVPLPPGVRCCAAAVMLGDTPDKPGDRLLGDGLVPLDSAIGRHPDPDRCLSFDGGDLWVGGGRNHLDLLSCPELYGQIRHWLA